MYKVAIFDLDQTLVNSKVSLSYRNVSMWQSVYDLIPNYKIYGGIKEILSTITGDKGVKVAVTSSYPREYVDMVLSHFEVPHDFTLGLSGDGTSNPDSDGYLRVLEYFGCKATYAISFGDEVDDIIASNAANVKSVACLWDSLEADDIRKVNPTFTINAPYEIMKFF